MRAPILHLGLSILAACALVACDRTPERAAPNPSTPSGAAQNQSTQNIAGDSSASAPNAAPSSLAADDRIAYLLEGCAKNEPFLENTSDPIPVLVSKLASGTLDPLRQARAELAEIGDPALPEMRRLFDRSYGESFLAQRLQNVVEVVALSRSHSGRDILLRALAHPQEIVRQAAARALVNHPDPSDYDTIEAALGLSTPDTQTDFALAMFASDRPRLEREFTDWVEARTQSNLVRTLAPKLADTNDPAILARWRAVYAKLDGDTRITLQAAVAKLPDEQAMAELRGFLKDKNPARREITARSLARVGLARELRAMVRDDPLETVRAEAVAAIASDVDDAETRAILTSATSDASAQVRNTALQALVARGDLGARDTVLTMLGGGRDDLEAAIRILREPMTRDRALAERVYTILVGLHTGETQPVLVDPRALERAIGQVPLEKSARYLMSLAEKPREKIQGLDAHRWFAQHATNSGPEARAWLRAQWANENDPTRRVDLVMAGSADRTPEVRRFLLDVLDSERSTPLEVLYVADRLAHLGPSSEVAPALKRVTLRMNDAKVRPALNCLMWNWYGLSK